MSHERDIVFRTLSKLYIAKSTIGAKLFKIDKWRMNLIIRPMAVDEFH